MRPATTTSIDGFEFRILDIADKIPPAHVVAMTAQSARTTSRMEAVLEVAKELSVQDN
jgi:hypothetical protein